MTEPHQVTHKQIRRGGEVFQKGDEFVPTEAELDAFSDRLEPVGGTPDEEEDPPPEETESGTLPFNPQEYTNDGVEEQVAEVDDEDALQALLNLEAEQQDRVGAKEAIEARLNEV